MNKKVLAMVVVALLLLAGAWYYISAKNSSKNPSVGTTSGAIGGVKSLKDLLSSGIAQKCTFATTDESGSSEGTTYVSGGKVRGDFTSTVSGKATVSHMISDGKTSYIWTDGEKTGFKMTVTEPTPGSVKTDASNAPANSEADLNQKADYKCSAWVVDGSFFTAPSSVTFSDFSQILNPSSAPSQGTDSSSASQCSYCNSLSGSDKTQCLTALNCK